jgi:hypothetical protein
MIESNTNLSMRATFSSIKGKGESENEYEKQHE